MEVCHDVDSWFRYYKDSPLEHYFMDFLGRPDHPLVTNIREKVGMRLITYRLDEIRDCISWLTCDLDSHTEKFLRKFIENVVDMRVRVFVNVRPDNVDRRCTTKILLEMGQDTEFTTTELSPFLHLVVSRKIGYETGRGFVEQLFVIDMILEAFP